ncbi:expressed unknown protein [Seminavis robusta]|uniref:Uncharacterized protein n=1 Tax=Seminavis robusta TaxID=568900 RepID=A0A9N8HNX9_9STRA|nr:expressed unknown protein [Seminavis robusta]|eukprot:Sro858_g211910.1 n/a (400) ;mRNA; r:40761-41960
MQQEDQEQKRRKRTRQADATLSDVFLCLCFSLGWAMFFLNSFLNTDLMRFSEGESVVVHGNVREVSIEDDQDGSGVPQYFAIIDYFINRDASRIQVRKAFQTQHLLQQGFANVELLVLPEEPTSSVLKEDWERELAAQEQAEEDIISIGGFGDFGDIGGFGDMGSTVNGAGDITPGASEKNGKPAIILSRVDVLAKRASLVLSGILVTASLIGAVQAVHRIPTEPMQSIGWVSVTLGSVLLWPLAMFCLRIVSTCQRLWRLPTEKSGIILKCDTNAQIGAAINEDKMTYTQYVGDNHGNISARHVDRVTHPELFEMLKNHNKQHDVTTIGNPHEAATPRNSNHTLLNASADDSACYFVKLPGQKDQAGSDMVRLDDSSMSTISANSQVSQSKRISESTT